MGLPLLPDLDLDPDFALSQLESALSGADDGELYLEHTKVQTLVYDDGRLKRASYDEDRGFGLRSVAGELTGYAHSDQVTEASLVRAGETAATAARSGGGTLALDPKRTNQRPYTDEDVIDAGPSFEKQVALAQTIDAHARAKDPSAAGDGIAVDCAQGCHRAPPRRLPGQRLTPHVVDAGFGDAAGRRQA